MNPKILYEKALGCLAALAIGDAMGMPVEMLSWDEIKETFGLIKDFERAPPWHPNRSLPPGKVTDDTELALLLARTIIRMKGKFRIEDFAEDLKKWAEKGALGLSYVGAATKESLKRLLNGADPTKSGGRNVTCGAAIRAPPIGIVNPGNLQGAVAMAVISSLPTHGGRSAISGASVIASAVAEAMVESSSIISIVNAAIEGSMIGERYGRPVPCPSISKRIKLAFEISNKIEDPWKAAFEIRDIIGTGMESAEAVPAALGIFAVSKGDPMAAICFAVNIGGDTDSVASMAAAISGAWKGIRAVNYKMLEKIEEVNKLNLKEVAKKLVEVASRRTNH